MSDFNWTTQNVLFVISQFDAGVAPAEIVSQLQSSGYETLQLVNIEQCLRSNGLTVNVCNPRYSQSFANKTFDVCENQSPTVSSALARNSFVGDIQGSPAASVPSRRLSVQINQGRGWDSAADKYAINAHEDGRSVVDIWEDLKRDGYNVKVSEVASSLSSQGVFSDKVGDYFVS